MQAIKPFPLKEIKELFTKYLEALKEAETVMKSLESIPEIKKAIDSYYRARVKKRLARWSLREPLFIVPYEEPPFGRIRYWRLLERIHETRIVLKSYLNDLKLFATYPNVPADIINAIRSLERKVEELETEFRKISLLG